MNRVWLGLAAPVAALAFHGAASAQSWSGAAFTAGPAFSSQSTGVTVHRGPIDFNGAVLTGSSNFGRHHGGRHDRRRNRGSDGFLGGWGYYDTDINRSWEADSYNDWWHDRPDRAFPRWVRHNENCAPERMWWSGGGWHC